MVWQVGVLLVGIGFLLVSLFASFILLNMTRSLRTIESISLVCGPLSALSHGSGHPRPIAPRGLLMFGKVQG